MEELYRRRSRIQPTSSPFADGWDFLCRATWTKDEASGRIRQFTAHEHLAYLTGVRSQHRIFAIEKSRRMMVTWWMLGLYLYDTLTSRNHANFIGSRKLEASAYLLGEERILGMYNRIPADVWPDKPSLEATGKHGMGYTLLTCRETGSYIQAIASGADQLRQYTASNVFFDEFAFFERAQETYGAVLPTIEGGGHIDIVSTPDLGAFMYTLLYQ